MLEVAGAGIEVVMLAPKSKSLDAKVNTCPIPLFSIHRRSQSRVIRIVSMHTHRLLSDCILYFLFLIESYCSIKYPVRQDYRSIGGMTF